MTNLAEHEARQRKAESLADAIGAATQDMPPTDVLHLATHATTEARTLAAKLAGVREPSDETWRLACLMVVQRRGQLERLEEQVRSSLEVARATA